MRARAQCQPDVGAAPLAGLRRAPRRRGRGRRSATIARPRPLPPSRLLAEARLKRSKARPRNSSREALAAVEHVDLDRAVVAPRARSSIVAGAVAKGVVDHAADRLVESQPVGVDRERRRGRYLDLAAPPPRPGGRSGGRRRRGRRAGSSALQAQRQLAALGLGDRQQVLGELGEPVGLLGGRGERRAQFLAASGPLPAPAPARCAGSPAACAARGWRRRRRRARARAPRRAARASRSASCPAARSRRRSAAPAGAGRARRPRSPPRATRIASTGLQRRGGDPVGGERGEEQGDRARRPGAAGRGR